MWTWRGRWVEGRGYGEHSLAPSLTTTHLEKKKRPIKAYLRLFFPCNHIKYYISVFVFFFLLYWLLCTKISLHYHTANLYRSNMTQHTLLKQSLLTMTTIQRSLHVHQAFKRPETATGAPAASGWWGKGRKLCVWGEGVERWRHVLSHPAGCCSNFFFFS